jgi:phosphate transport system protein
MEKEKICMILHLAKGDDVMAPRKHFNEELKDLKNMVLNMGELAEKSVISAMKSMMERNKELAKKVIEGDEEIGQYNADIEMKCYELLALQNPVAVDLRTISSSNRIGVELERIGDYAEDIADVVVDTAHKPLIEVAEDLNRMAELSRKMIKISLQAFECDDAYTVFKLAFDLAKYDDDVDNMYIQIFQELVTYLKQEKHGFFTCLNMLLVARYLERIGDHACNIGERAVYMITGERMKIT